MKRIFLILALIPLCTSAVAARTMLENARFALEFAPDGRPASFVLKDDGTELLNLANPGRGFYLTNDSKPAIPLSIVALRGKDRLVVQSENRSQEVVFQVGRGDSYLSFRISRLKGIPQSSALKLHFEMNARGNVRAMALDFMTPHLDHLRGRVAVDFPFLYHRYADDPLGGFALYCPSDARDEDDTILHIWGEQDLPHPKTAKEWSYETAREWVAGWQERFSDQSRMMFEAASPEDLYRGAEYARKAGLKGIYLMPWVWRGSYWPTDMPNTAVNTNLFPQGRADVKRYSRFLQDKGMRLLFHYVSGGIGFEDPKYVGSKPDRRLASWGAGAPAEAIDTEQTVIRWIPGEGVELPYRIPRALVHSFNALPPAMHFFHNFDMVRIEDEIIKVGSFENTDKGVWTLRGCKRGMYNTEAAAHPAGSDSAGLIYAYNINFIPDNNSSLLDEIAGNFADLINECGIMNTEYDGGEIHCYEGPSQSIGWGYNKFTSLVYAKLDHPVMADSSAQRPPECHIEYKLNSTRDIVGPITGHQYYVNLMTNHISRPATTLLDANFQLSQVAATGSACYGLKTQDRGVGIADLETHGLTGSVIDAIRNWKEVAPLLTEKERKRILRGEYGRKHLDQGGSYPQSDLVQVLEEDDDAYRIYPSKVLTRTSGDIKWSLGQEHGVIAPKQFVKPGDELELQNPFAAQEMQFIIRVLWQTDYDNEDNLPLQPTADSIENLRSMRVSQAGGNKIAIACDNRLDDAVWNQDDLPRWKRKADLSAHRSLGMWIDGDGSGALLLIQIPKRDYVVPIDFKGRKYIEIAHGQAAWSMGEWGWRIGTWKHARYDNAKRIDIGLGMIPPQSGVDIALEGLKALKEIPAELVNPTISADGGRLRVEGTVATGQYLQYAGGETAQVYDRNWNLLRNLPVAKEDYRIPNGACEVAVRGEGPDKPWLETQFITRDKAIVLDKISK